MAVEKAARTVGSVAEAVVNLETKELTLTFTGDAEEEELVKAAVKEAGYTPL